MSLLCLLLLGNSLLQWYQDWQLVTKNLRMIRGPETIHQAQSLIAELPKQHLFGGQGPAVLPVTHLPIRVEGILITSSMEAAHTAQSSVLLAIDDHPAKVYHVGERILGIQVYKITAHSVVLDNNGRLETLSLQRPSLH